MAAPNFGTTSYPIRRVHEDVTVVDFDIKKIDDSTRDF